MSCPNCFKGHTHEGNPGGKITKLHGLQTYVAEPAKPREVKGIIVIIPDAFGWDFVNNRLLADHYAEKGDYRVYLPDFMLGNSSPVWVLDSLRVVMSKESSYLSKAYHMSMSLMSLVPWMITNRAAKSYPRVKAFFTQLHAAEGATLPVGAAGFCWGGKHTLLLAADEADDGKPFINAGFTGHPSGIVLPDDVEKTKVPISFAIAELDSQSPPEVIAKIRTIIEAKPAEQKCEVKVYDGCNHGFCVRADITEPENAKQVDASENQCIGFFNKHFKTLY